MNCDFIITDGPNKDGRYKHRCRRPKCARVTGWCRKKVAATCLVGPMLGDWFARFVSRLGVKQKGCGCGERQEILNYWSWEVTHAIRRLWELFVGVPHDLLTKSLLRIAALLKRTKS